MIPLKVDWQAESDKVVLFELLIQTDSKTHDKK